jgi:hypothetical protein
MVSSERTIKVLVIPTLKLSGVTRSHQVRHNVKMDFSDNFFRNFAYEWRNSEASTEEQGLVRTTHVDGFQINVCNNPVLSFQVLTMNRNREVFGHYLVNIDDLNARCFEGKRKFPQGVIPVKFGSMDETTSPGKDRGDGIGRSFVPFLILTIVSRDGAFSSVSRWASVSVDECYHVRPRSRQFYHPV